MMTAWGHNLDSEVFGAQLVITSPSVPDNDLSTLPSIDLLDMAFNYMDIEDETCRMKTICQAENYAVNHPVARLAINTLK